MRIYELSFQSSTKIEAQNFYSHSVRLQTAVNPEQVPSERLLYTTKLVKT